MSWLVRIDPMQKENFRKFLDEVSLDAQMLGQPEDAIAQQRSQFEVLKSAAAVLADWIPGPKIAGKIEGHVNGAGEAMPHGAQASRVTIDLYQVRFAGE